MGKMQRKKGRKGEQETIHLLQPIVNEVFHAAGKVPPKLKRTSSTQADGGGSDVCGLDWLALEVKRDEGMSPDMMWRQCLSQAYGNQVPVLLYRRNHGQWRARTYIYNVFDSCTLAADLSIDDFLLYFKHMLIVWLQTT